MTGSQMRRCSHAYMPSPRPPAALPSVPMCACHLLKKAAQALRSHHEGQSCDSAGLQHSLVRRGLPRHWAIRVTTDTLGVPFLCAVPSLSSAHSPSPTPSSVKHTPPATTGHRDKESPPRMIHVQLGVGGQRPCLRGTQPAGRQGLGSDSCLPLLECVSFPISDTRIPG